MAMRGAPTPVPPPRWIPQAEKQVHATCGNITGALLEKVMMARQPDGRTFAEFLEECLDDENPSGIRADVAEEAAVLECGVESARSVCQSFRIDADEDGDDMARAEGEFFPEYDTTEKDPIESSGMHDPVHEGDCPLPHGV